MTAFALIHSPLVGPLTWSRVAVRLGQLGHAVAMPTLRDSENEARPYWAQHAESAADAINSSSPAQPPVLVGHSGAGPLLPAIGARLTRPPAGYIFVDAGLPRDGASRLDLMKTESLAWALEFEQHLLAGGRFPEWRDEDLRSSLPDDTLRRQMLSELRPRAYAFFAEPLSAPEGWQALPCGVIQFTETYAGAARFAADAGWPCLRFQAGHFHMLVAADVIAMALTEIADQLVDGSPSASREDR